MITKLDRDISIRVLNGMLQFLNSVQSADALIDDKLSGFDFGKNRVGYQLGFLVDSSTRVCNKVRDFGNQFDRNLATISQGEFYEILSDGWIKLPDFFSEALDLKKAINNQSHLPQQVCDALLEYADTLTRALLDFNSELDYCIKLLDDEEN